MKKGCATLSRAASVHCKVFRIDWIYLFRGLSLPLQQRREAVVHHSHHPDNILNRSARQVSCRALHHAESSTCNRQKINRNRINFLLHFIFVSVCGRFWDSIFTTFAPPFLSLSLPHIGFRDSCVIAQLHKADKGNFLCCDNNVAHFMSSPYSEMQTVSTSLAVCSAGSWQSVLIVITKLMLMRKA